MESIMSNTLYIFGGILFILLLFFYPLRHILGGISGFYRVVPVNEAHIRILGGGKGRKDIFSSREGSRPSYWYVPGITKLHKLPLSNLAIPVDDIKLNDKNMAKFVTDIMCFINISDLQLAAERLTLTETRSDLGFDFEKLQVELRAIIESIGRTVTTKQTILDIYMSRDLLDGAITDEVAKVFPNWGIALVDLELKDIKDAPDSNIISDIERKIASEISRDARTKVAEMESQAAIKEAEANKEQQLVKAKTEEEFRKRQIEKDQAIAIAEQNKAMAESEAQRKANQQFIEAEKVKIVGQANNKAEAAVRIAEGEKRAAIEKAEGDAALVQKKGEAEAAVVKAKKVAEAEGTEKLAEALKKFDDAAMNAKRLEVLQVVAVAKFEALANIAKEADIKWIMSGATAQSFFGLNLNAEGGANLEQFATESGMGGIVNKVVEALKEKSK